MTNKTEVLVHVYLKTCFALLLVIFIMQWPAIKGRSALASEGVVMGRIQSNKTLRFYFDEMGEPGRRLVVKLDERSSELGAVPSRSETIRILSESEVELTLQEMLWVETIIRGIQQPRVTSKVLFDMFQTFSKTLPPLNCTFRVAARFDAQAGGPAGTEKIVECQYSRSANNSIFFSKSGDLSDANIRRATWIFNGLEMREIEDAYKGLSNEYVFIPPNLRALYSENHPLTVARIAPEEGAQNPDVRQHSGFSVFEDSATVVFESGEVREGKEYVAVGFLDWVMLLDPTLNYAIVEERFGEIDFQKKYVATAPHHVRQNSDFVQLGDGPFLPRRSLSKQWRSGRMYKDVETVVESLVVQPQHSLEESFVRPERLHVANSINGQSSLSAGASPKGAVDVKSKKATGKYWLLVGGNAVIVVFLIFFVRYWRRR